MTSISKNVYTDKLNDIVNKYDNIYHRTIKIKPAGAKDNTYIDFNKEVNDKDPNFNILVILMVKKLSEHFMKKNCKKKNKSKRI